ncbi:hypothetical protein PIB30_100116 [Stylosanthes scabra]|uniref:Putative plant transposon protein domain-containing protein n=1 Tax=Stylosanthes scabra TaxID=79078 RepID=A0ABU6TWI8_9FABA|nr:hypothetical protein [Stylosanthes scabra]
MSTASVRHTTSSSSNPMQRKERLAAPRTSISKLLVQKFYANAAVSDEEAAGRDEFPYKSFVRGKEARRGVEGFVCSGSYMKAEPKSTCCPHSTQKDRINTISQRLARVHNPLTCSNGEQIRSHNNKAILIHSIMQGEDVRVKDIIADNMATITQGLTNKGNLAHPSTIYKLCKDAGVLLREFIRTPRIPKLSYIAAKRMETIRFLILMYLSWF